MNERIINFEEKNAFLNAVEERKKQIIDYMLSKDYQELFAPPHLHEDIYTAVIGEVKLDSEMWHCYIRRSSKALRPAVLMFSCGAVGGEEEKAIPAAAAVEVWHTFTLVHDDIIDKDPIRRHEKTVHKFYSELGEKRGMPKMEAKHYGVSIGILAGDLLDGWSKHLITDLYIKYGVKPEVVLALIRELEGYVTATLATGQTKDVYFVTKPVSEISINEIVEMLRQKTAALYEFAGRAGAMIGLNTENRNDKLVELIAEITCKCGIAFQLQDDILGIIGETEKTGKPVGADIVQGKRTTIVRYAWENANHEQKRRLEYLLNLKKRLTAKQLQEAITLLQHLKGIDQTKELARQFVDGASKLLEKVPTTKSSSKYIALIRNWIDFMINRDL